MALPPSAHRSFASFQDNPIPPAVDTNEIAPEPCVPSVVPASLTTVMV